MLERPRGRVVQIPPPLLFILNFLDVFREMTKQNIAIIAAAGKGRRMGLMDKAFLMLKDKPVLYYSVLPFEKSDLVDEIVIAVNKEKVNYAKKIIDKYGFKKAKKVVAGGSERQDSVYNALESIAESGYILVHDAARPLVSEGLIQEVMKAAQKFGAAVPACPVADTIKRGKEFVEETLVRESLWVVQTPQAFGYEILKKAYETARRNRYYGTDDSSLIERFGYEIKIVEGYPENIKITTPSDLVIAEALLKKGPASRFSRRKYNIKKGQSIEVPVNGNKIKPFKIVRDQWAAIIFF